ncbi:MAG TPA: hypothetical protein VF221_21660 [Chloroflexota bacterium]
MDCSITVKGHLDQRCSDWFDGLTIIHRENSETVLTGHLPDQAAIHGVLARVRDRGLSLLTVECTEERAHRTGSL